MITISTLTKRLLAKLNYSYFIIVLLVFSRCKDNASAITTVNDNEHTVDMSTDIPVHNFTSFEPLLYTTSNKTYIVNFWAMWCAPCVKELPYIQQYAKAYPDAEILLVSLDFQKDIDTKLKPFLQKHGITSKVVLLDDPDSNTWIDKIDPNWSGAIPFTIIFNAEKRAFFERSFESFEDLENEVQNTIHKY
ncbi:TlpA family protein disulfide reductase [Psychroserpens damuponensis]|uniref:TlpA family protein disulfide reductase n=1 Tax=Psychroserpens damuponensis TaxID=943936 RepID=UPI000694ECBE|nr:TlpA disulfide reductase family protein [Psychroserpens damuponensis]